jgi:hypothetical protein
VRAVLADGEEPLVAWDTSVVEKSEVRCSLFGRHYTLSQVSVKAGQLL